MSQKLLIQCPNCNARLALPNSSQSEFTVGCPKCQLQFRVQNPEPLPASQPINPAAENLGRLEPVEETPSTLEHPPLASGNRPVRQSPTPVVQAETAKPARLVRAVPVDDGGGQNPSPSPSPPNSYQQPHVGATQLPIDSKGNFKGSVTKRDLPNFDFEATNAKFELHANAPGNKLNFVDASEEKAEATTNPTPQIKQPAESVAEADTKPVTEPTVESAQPESDPAHQFVKEEKQHTEFVSSGTKQESNDLELPSAASADSRGASPAKGEPSPLKRAPTASLPAKDKKKFSPAPMPEATAADNSSVARAKSLELEVTKGAGSAPAHSDAQPEVAHRSNAKVERLEPVTKPEEEASRARAEGSPLQTDHATAAQPAKETQPSAAKLEKDKLAKIAAFVGKDEGNSRKRRRGKRGRRNKKKAAQVAKPSNAGVRSQASAGNKAVSKHSPQTDLQKTGEIANVNATLKSKSTSTSPSKPQAEARVTEGAKQSQPQIVAAERPSARNAKPVVPKEEPASGTYSEHKSSKRLKKKSAKRGGVAAKRRVGSAKKEKLVATPAKAKSKEQGVRREPEQSSEQDWTSYHYLANRSNTSRKKRKAIVAGAVSFLALCFAIWAVIKADLFKEFSRPDSSDSGNELAVETPVDSSHPFLNLYIKILQARIESLEQLSPTAEAMISYRQKNPVAGDLEYLLEKAVAEEPAPREARKPILADLSKLENEQENLEADLLKKMSKAERRKWDKWLRTESTERKELVTELQLCFKSYRSDGLFSLPVPAPDEEAVWLSLEETQVVRNCLKSLVDVDSTKAANLAGTRVFKEADALFANAIKRTEAKNSSSEVPRSYKEFLFAAKMARNALVNRIKREQLLTPALNASLQRLDAAHEAFRLAGIGKPEAEVRAAFPNTASSVANAP